MRKLGLTITVLAIILLVVALNHANVPVAIKSTTILSIDLVTAVWTYIDAKRLLSRIPQKTDLGFASSATLSAVSVFLIWLIAFPLYLLSTRPWLQGLASESEGRAR